MNVVEWFSYLNVSFFLLLINGEKDSVMQNIELKESTFYVEGAGF